ncbi:MAG: peptide ABC transporter substrate-binding protein [Dehalococcoidia bacterium]|nr:peptide ABC transporter substrate-binding protein [Dehalococcoidia bacterium]
MIGEESWVVGSWSRARLVRAPLVLFGALILAATLVGCGDADPAFTEPTATGAVGTATATAALDAEQVLHANLTSEPTTLDPQQASDQVSLTLVRNLYSGLLRLDADDHLTADLAEEIPDGENGDVSEDGQTYTFHLREGLLWSDGTPLVAQAFVDGANRLFAPGSANPYVDFYQMIDSVEAPDDRTVVYHLNRPSPEFLLLATLWPLYPVRQDLADANGEQWTEAGRLVSNGPFVLDVWEHGERVRLVRNEHYHRDPAGLEAIEFDLIDDSAVAFLAYQNDELDVVLLGPAELVQVRGNEALRDEFIGYAQLRTIGLYLNAGDPLLSDQRVRQALAGSLNREEYAGAVLEGNAAPAYGWIPPGMPGYDPDAGKQFADAVDESRALVEDAGAQGAELTLLVPEASSSVLTAEWLQSQWQTNLGITVKLDIRETASYVAAYSAGEFQIAIGGWNADYPDPQNWLPPFSTSSPLNFGGYSNPEFDRLLEEAGTEVNFERRLELYAEAHRILIDDVGVIPLNHPLRGALVKPWVQGIEPSAREGVVPGDLSFESITISGRP